MRNKASDKTQSGRLLPFVKGYIYLTATGVALVGCFLLSTAWATRDSNDRWLGWNDSLLGINNRALLVIGGVRHLAAAAYLFAGRDWLNRTLAVLWLGLNHLIYYAGIQWTDPTALPKAERFLGWRLQLQPGAVDLRWQILQGYLIIASAVFLVLIWRHSTLLKQEAWFRQWRESRTQPSKEKPDPSKKSKPEEQHDGYTKIACSHCGQKIAFPLSRAGESIACPGCGQTVVLQAA